MAYNKKYAELGESVIDYVNNREDAIEASFDDVDTDINGVSQELNDFKAEIADYVVEQGANYTKWNSGKLEQYILVYGIANANTNTTILGDLPVTYTASNSIQATLRTADNNVSQIEVKRAINSGNNQVSIMVNNIRNEDQNIEIYIYFLGRWK